MHYVVKAYGFPAQPGYYEIKDPKIEAQVSTVGGVTEAQKLNGILYIGNGVLGVAAYRKWDAKKSAWTEWKDGNGGFMNYLAISKEHGTWKSKQPIVVPMTCAEVPGAGAGSN